MHVLSHAEVSVIVAEDQEQVDKLLSLKAELPQLRLIIYEDPRGMSSYSDSMLKSFADIEAAGRTFGEQHPDYYDREVDQGRAADVALIAFGGQCLDDAADFHVGVLFFSSACGDCAC
mgnify:CR=1 FL=1